MSRTRSTMPFLVLAIVFMTLGMTTNRALSFVGLVFFVIALYVIASRRDRPGRGAP